MLVLQNANRRITLNDFLDTLLADPAPQCIMWLPLMHRMANVENGKWGIGVGEGLGGLEGVRGLDVRVGD